MGLSNIPGRKRDAHHQRTAEWYADRIGKVTASSLNAMLSFKKDGEPAYARRRLLDEKVTERITKANTEHYASPAMTRGNEQEAPGLALYEKVTCGSITDCGFFNHPEIDNCGASPDALVGEFGLVELKVPMQKKWDEWSGMLDCPDDYKAQMTLQIDCTGRDWCDFAAYNPGDLDGSEPRILVWRFTPTQEEILLLRVQIRVFLAEIEAEYRNRLRIIF